MDELRASAGHPAAAVAAVDGASGAILTIDRAGGLQFVNAEAAELLRRFSSETTLWTALPEAVAVIVRSVAEEALEQGRRRVAADLVWWGSTWRRVAATPTGDHLVLHLSDATEQWQAEERLRQHVKESRRRNEELDQLLTSWGVVVSYVDSELRYTKIVNVPARYGEASYVGKRAYEFTDSEGGRAVAALQLEVLESGRALLREVHYEGADGGRTWLLYGELLRAGDGSVLGVKTMGLDVTAVRNAEAAASTDYLTGIPNRRTMEGLVRQELLRAERYGTEFSILLLDIDEFKQVNDRHGHPVGDEVLRACVRCLHEELRIADSIARWGGEEFLVLLPETGREEAVNVAERMRRRVEAHSFDVAGRITISLGVATPLHAEGARDLVARADAACLRAKRAGRNTVVLASTGSGSDEEVDRARPLFEGYVAPRPADAADWPRFEVPHGGVERERRDR